MVKILFGVPDGVVDGGGVARSCTRPVLCPSRRCLMRRGKDWPWCVPSCAGSPTSTDPITWLMVLRTTSRKTSLDLMAVVKLKMASLSDVPELCLVLPTWQCTRGSPYDLQEDGLDGGLDAADVVGVDAYVGAPLVGVLGPWLAPRINKVKDKSPLKWVY